MKRIEFALTMPGRNSWNGQWSGQGRPYLKYRYITNKYCIALGFDKANERSWSHAFGDGWCACVTGRVMAAGERKKKSAGFAGYDWMVDSIMWHNEIRSQ